MSILHKLPAAFIERMSSLPGSELTQFLSSFDQPPPVSVRVNPYKFIDQFDEYEPVSWASNAFYLPERISFTLEPLFHAGCYYVQEASSMFLEKVLTQIAGGSKNMTILDLCAAPGGKSTHILSTLPDAFLVSNEIVPSRNKILHYNLTKWGKSNVVLTQNNAEDFNRLPGFFDIIMIDAPCSGEGLFRKDEKAIAEWSEQMVNVCTIRQRTIIAEVLPSLKQGGYLVYSTCTYEESENEDQISRLINQQGMELVKIDDVGEGITETKFGYRFYHHRIKGEGFFISVLRKTDFVSEFKSLSDKKNMKGKLIPPGYLDDPGNFVSYEKGTEIYALPLEYRDRIMALISTLYVRKAGIHIGTYKGNDLVPSHVLAHSINLHPEIPKIDLEKTEALRFLRCENINALNVPKGWLLACYQGFPLGWIKSLGSRINNYFPREHRILMNRF